MTQEQAELNIEPHDVVVVAPEQTSSTRFPVALQLVLLGLLLFGLFSVVSDSPQALVSAVTGQSKNGPEEGGVKSVATVQMDTFGPYEIPEEIIIGAKAAYVWDVVGQRALYAKASDTVLPLASITKLMTTLVTYELVAEDTRVTIPSTATSQQSASGLRSGEVFSAGALSQLALLASSNDAAYSLGNAIGGLLGEGRAVERFVAAMNVRAEELNLPSLRFYNTTGLDLTMSDAGAYGNAKDTTMLMEYMLRNYPDLLTITTTEATRVYSAGGAYHDAENTNGFITGIPNVLGSKTGYTDLAGGNLIVAFDAGFNRPIIVTVLGSSHRGRFVDVQTLVDAVLTSPAD